MYFINCDNRKHQEIFSNEAFFDLDTTGHQALLATELLPGDICIVISYEDKKKTKVKVSWYKFLHEQRMDDNKGNPFRVLCGEFQKSEVMLKTDAAINIKLSRFFNVKGHFKQQSVVK